MYQTIRVFTQTNILKNITAQIYINITRSTDVLKVHQKEKQSQNAAAKGIFSVYHSNTSCKIHSGWIDLALQIASNLYKIHKTEESHYRR